MNFDALLKMFQPRQQQQVFPEEMQQGDMGFQLGNDNRPMQQPMAQAQPQQQQGGLNGVIQNLLKYRYNP